MATSKEMLIIGYGTVGNNLARELSTLTISVEDRYKNRHSEVKQKDFGFVCVDTPLKEDNTLDITQVRNAIAENDCKIYVIKSTCPVGTVDMLKEETGKRIIFSPEYYGGTQHCNNFEFNFTVLGGDPKDCREVVQLLQNVYDGRHTFRIVDAKTAEMVKFMENSWLAAKVSFCNAFGEACKKAEIDYETLRELFILDPRVNPSHTFVYEEHPFWDSHCLNKDVPSVAEQFDMELLKSIVEINKKAKSFYSK